LLWDCVPRGLFLGGAPVNAAYHLRRQGGHALPISAVGRDFLGDEILRRLAKSGLDTRFIARSARHPTGTVAAALDNAGVPAFRITRSVAWDHIPISRGLLRITPPAAIIFGTLALRETSNRRALDTLLAAWPEALRVVDLNLRPPFLAEKAIDAVLAEAQLLKLNEHELGRLAGRTSRTPDGLARAVREVGHKRRISRICVTAGGRGAGLLWDDDWFWQKGRPVKVRDTIGAGDAFLAGFLAALLLRQESPRAALAHACRMGEFVAARDGSMPPYRCGPRGRPVDLKT
jgi:fructokinase